MVLANDLHQDLIENNIFDIDHTECFRKLIAFHQASSIVPNNNNNNSNNDNKNDNNKTDDVEEQRTHTEDDEGSNLL